MDIPTEVFGNRHPAAVTLCTSCRTRSLPFWSHADTFPSASKKGLIVSSLFHPEDPSACTFDRRMPSRTKDCTGTLPDPNGPTRSRYPARAKGSPTRKRDRCRSPSTIFNPSTIFSFRLWTGFGAYFLFWCLLFVLIRQGLRGGVRASTLEEEELD